MNRVALALLLLLCVGVVLLPRQAPACGVAPPEFGRVDISTESALIVWDEATKTEHFIRRAIFQSTSLDFGFLVPTPTKPDMEEADDNLFVELAKLTAPKIEERTTYALSFGCGYKMSPAGRNDHAPGGGVVLLQRKRVGPFEAATLGFDLRSGDDVETGAAGLAKWLTENKYPFTPALKEWSKVYIRDNWVITAFKIDAPPPEDVSKPTNSGVTVPSAKGNPQQRDQGYTLKAAAVRMSFKTPRPFYPYREPANQRDAAASQVPRSLQVFVAAENRMAGKLGDGAQPWPGRVQWANAVATETWPGLLAQARVTATPGALWLTEFEDRSTPRPGTDEVYFEPSADQSAIARPPSIRWVHNETPWTIGFFTALGLPALAIAFLLLRRLRR